VWPIIHFGKRGVLYKKRRIELDRPSPLRLQIREILTIFTPGRNPVNVIDPTGMYTYYLQSDGTMIREGEEEDYGLDKPIASVHSHPDVIPSLEKEKESMGYWPIDYVAEAFNSRKDIRNNGSTARKSYVYFPNSSRLYFVGYYEPRYIRSINNYRQFYFGTLNHR